MTLSDRYIRATAATVAHTFRSAYRTLNTECASNLARTAPYLITDKVGPTILIDCLIERCIERQFNSVMAIRQHTVWRVRLSIMPMSRITSVKLLCTMS